MSSVEPKKRIFNLASESRTFNNLGIDGYGLIVILDFNFEMMKPFLDTGMEKNQMGYGHFADRSIFDVTEIRQELNSDDENIIDIIGTINILATKTKFNITVHRDIFDEILTLGCQHFFGENHEMKLKHAWFQANNYDVSLRIFNIDEQEND
jgi:hypothetical protein